jgi:hypothetical protein
MSNQVRRSIVMTLAAVVIAAAWPQFTLAEERFVSGTLKKTYIKSDDSTILLPGGYGPNGELLTPTTVMCPNNGTCTLAVSFSSEIVLLPASPSSYIHLGIVVDGQFVDSVLFEYASQTVSAGVRSFTFVHQGLLPGEHTVSVNLASGQYQAGSWLGNRTLVIDVLKP